MPLREVFHSIRSSFNERISNPLIGSFIISWCVFNWDILLFLFYANNNLRELTAIIMKIKQKDLAHIFLLPFFFSIFYVLLGPWVTLLLNTLRESPIEKAKIKNMRSEAKNQQMRIELIEAEAKAEVAKNNILLDVRNKEIAAEERELEIKRLKEDFEMKFEELREEKKKLEEMRSEVEAAKLKLSPNSKGFSLGNNKSDNGLIFDDEIQVEYNMSEEAKTLLRTAASSGDGAIMKISYLGGRHIQVGEEKFGGKEGKEFAKWENALNQLVNLNFVIERGSKGERFELTHQGWTMAEKL